MKNCSVAAKQQVVSCKNNVSALETLTAAQKASTFAAKAQAVAFKAFSIAANMLIYMAIAKGIQFAVEKINDFIHASEKAREASSELTNAWNSENNSINESINKYKELSEKLSDTSLTTEDIKNVKKELSSVQDTLVEKYGQEALGIDLVNGKYDEQISKLDELSKKKAQDYVAKNYENIKTDKQYVDQIFAISKQFSYTGLKTEPINYDAFGFDLKKFMDDYDKLDMRIDNIIGPNGTLGHISLVGKGTREEVYGQLSSLFSDLTNEFGEGNPQVNAFKSTLSNIMEESFDTQALEAAKNNINHYVEAEILGDDTARAVYQNAIVAVEAYNDALSSGEGITQAKENLASIQAQVEKVTDRIEGSSQVFQRIFDGINENAKSIASNTANAFEPVVKSKAIEKVNSLSEGFESLQKIMSAMESEDPFDFALLDDEKFKKNFGELEDVYTNFIETISNSPKDISACQSAFDNLVSAFLTANDVTSVLDENTKSVVTSMLENKGVTNANALTTEYLASKKAAAALQTLNLAEASEDEILALINEQVEADHATESFKAYVAQKMLADFAVSTDGDIKALANVINALGLATDAWSRYYAAKAKMDQMGAGRQVRSDGEVYYTYKTEEDGRTINHIASQLAYDQENRKATSALKNLAKELEAKADVSFSNKDVSSSNKKNNSKGSGGSKAKETKEFTGEIDAATQSIKNLETELSKLDRELNSDTLSYSEQIPIFDQIISQQKKIADGYASMASVYEAAWNGAMANLPQEYIDMITSGTVFDVKDFSGNEALYNQVKEAMDIYNKMIDAQQQYADKSLEIEKRRIEKYKRLQEKLDNELDMVKNRKSSVQNELDRLDNLNQIASEDQYREMIKYSKQEEELYEEKIELAEKALRTTKYGTQRYYELKNMIASCRDAIADCQQQQDRWNQAILEIPIKVLEKENEKLDQQINKLEKLKGEKDNAISGALDIIDTQKEALEKNQEDIEKYYDAQIEALNKEKDIIQDQIDALQKKNDEINRTIETEKKLAALEAAKQNKNKRILKNGEWTYVEDIDAIQNAQSDYNNQLNENKIAELEDKKTGLDDKISGLEENKDKDVENIQKQIDALDEYRKKWDEITSSFERERNLALLAAQMGLTLDQVKQEILAGNLDLLAKMTDSYRQVEIDLNTLNKTKEHNEELIQTFQNYVQAWQDGEISIGEAKAAIQELVDDNEIEIEAMTERVNSVFSYSDRWRQSREEIEENLGLLTESEALSAEEEAASLKLRGQSLGEFGETFNTTLSSIVSNANTQLDALAQNISSKADLIQQRCEDICKAVSEALAAEKKLNGDDDDSSSRKSSSSTKNGAYISPKVNGVGGPGYVTKHDGIKSGLVGNNANTAINEEEALKALSLERINPDEVFAKLQYKEAVLTQEQIKNLLHNYNVVASVPKIEMPIATPNEVNNKTEVNFNGGIHITEVENGIQVSQQVLTRLEQGLMQAQYSKRYK